MKPLAIDLFCGLGGWAEGCISEGYDVIGFDIERHVYGEHHYPGQLVLQDVTTLHGSQFRSATLIVASPPCQAYSYRAMPWKRAKALPPPDNTLFDACFRIQRETSEAAGHHIPLIVENVCGAQKWVGRATWHYGSNYLWGDVPALMPVAFKTRIKFPAHCGPRLWKERDVKGLNHHQRSIMHREGTKGVPHRTTGHWTNPAESGGVKQGGDWFNREAMSRGSMARFSSKSNARKFASAIIAKIPFPLARHIARVFKEIR